MVKIHNLAIVYKYSKNCNPSNIKYGVRFNNRFGLFDSNLNCIFIEDLSHNKVQVLNSQYTEVLFDIVEYRDVSPIVIKYIKKHYSDGMYQ